MPERTLREIYLPGFKAAVVDGECLAVMGAYNKFRGQYCSHNHYLVQGILKGEWNFNGCFLSDWAAVEDTFEAARFGLDLEMALTDPAFALLPAGAVVFSRDATVGLSAITTRSMAVSQHFIAWLCGDEMLPEYLLRVFRAMTQELDRLTMGATIKTIGMPDVRTLVTPVPPKDEQKVIVQHVLEETRKIDALVAKIREGIEKLKEYRTALISAAVTGKIDVREDVVA